MHIDEYVLKEKAIFLNEVENRLRRLFMVSQQGHRPPTRDRHHLEGFMQAGVFMELATGEELNELMEDVHRSVFGQTIAERRVSHAGSASREHIDYSSYDQPTFERTRKDPQ